MKRMIFPIIGIVLSLGATAQYTEFKQSKSGLIYSDTTINQLKFIVDSLNLKFKVCELNKDYFSFYQSKAHFIKVNKKHFKEAKADMDRNISLSEFEEKYHPELQSDLLVIRYKYKNYKDINTIEFSCIRMGKVGEHELEFTRNLDDYEKPLKHKWLYNYYDSKDYESLEILYIVDEFERIKLPEKYARMVLYADCLIDTNNLIFSEQAQKNKWSSNDDNPDNSDYGIFMQYVDQKTNKPVYKYDMEDEDAKAYYKQYEIWDSLRFVLLDSIRLVDKKFDKLLLRAIVEVQKNGISSDFFEQYVARYYSPKTALDFKRNRVVVGRCSMDRSPRIHALNIAILSAETISWEIFLRAHLDIMNDRFERASDGSYAWAERKTYIKELEVLDINVHDLLLGISLRIDNPSKNHYFGNIGRLGRAFTETVYQQDIELKMLEMIADNSLDNYNRVLLYYLYLNYVYNFEDKSIQKQKLETLNTYVEKMPSFIASRILNK